MKPFPAWAEVMIFMIVVLGGAHTAIWHVGPCHEWPFYDYGEHVRGNESWGRLDVNSVALFQSHACLDSDGYATKSWVEVLERRLAPEPTEAECNRSGFDDADCSRYET